MAKETCLGVVDVFLLKPFNEDLFFETIKKYDHVITLEEGFIHKGGLDSLVSNTLDKRDSYLKLRRLGFGEGYVFDMGSREHLHKLHNLDEESIIRTVKECLR
jgi:transketolase